MNFKKIISTYPDFFLLSILLVTSALIQHDLIIANPILTRDDFLFVEEAALYDSWSKYWNAFKNFYLQDLQPLRDLTFYVDHFLTNKIYPSHHLTNLIISFLVLVQINKLLKRVFPTKVLTRALILILFTIHPIFVMTTAWVSARKHLMAFGFVLALFNELLNARPSSVKMCFLFMCSVASQPIFGLAPVFIFLNNNLWKKIDKKGFLALTAVSLIAIIFNIIFYRYKSGILNTEYVHAFDMSIRVSSLGRSFVQIFIPFRQAAEYDRASILSFIGFGIFTVFILIIYKKVKFKTFFLYLSLLVLTLYPTLQYFTKESYLLAPCLATLVITFIVAEKFNPKLMFGIFVILLTMFSFISIRKVNMWSSDIALWKESFENEGGIYSSIFYARYLINVNPSLAEDITAHVLEEYKLHFLNIDFILCSSIVGNPKYTNEEKMKRLRSYLLKYPRVDSYITRFYIGIVFFDHKLSDLAFDIFRKDFEKYKDRKNPISGIMYDKLKFACASYNDKLCDRLNEFKL